MIINSPLVSNNKIPQIANGTLEELTASDLHGATIISERSFCSHPNLVKVTIPESVTEIKNNAFADNAKLKHLILKGDNGKILESISAFSGTPLNDAITLNRAGFATYKASSNCVANTSNPNSFGEADWNTYHKGKLNDGYLPADDTADSFKKRNTEFYISAFTAGTVYLYFKFDFPICVGSVDAFFGDRTSEGATSRGYPSSCEVFVGNSENDTQSSNKLGDMTPYSVPGFTKVKRYTVSNSNPKTGKYVILKIRISASATVIALSEVEIFGFKVIDDIGIYIDNSANIDFQDLVDLYDGYGWTQYLGIMKPISEYPKIE